MKKNSLQTIFLWFFPLKSKMGEISSETQVLKKLSGWDEQLKHLIAECQLAVENFKQLKVHEE